MLDLRENARSSWSLVALWGAFNNVYIGRLLSQLRAHLLKTVAV
jgi:hypothetical protein